MIAAAAVMTRAVPAATRGLITRFLALHDRVPGAIPGLVDALTEREREIVALVATGMLNAEIADRKAPRPGRYLLLWRPLFAGEQQGSLLGTIHARSHDDDHDR